MPKYKNHVHYGGVNGNPVCNTIDKHQVTHRPRLVTCVRCKKTRAYQEMMEDPT